MGVLAPRQNGTPGHEHASELCPLYGLMRRFGGFAGRNRRCRSRLGAEAMRLSQTDYCEQRSWPAGAGGRHGNDLR